MTRQRKPKLNLKPTLPTPFRLYLHAMAGQLAIMAKNENLPVLARIFAMAEHEAAGLGDGQAAEILRARHGLERG